MSDADDQDDLLTGLRAEQTFAAGSRAFDELIQQMMIAWDTLIGVAVRSPPPFVNSDVIVNIALC
jgi:hypothetical protein